MSPSELEEILAADPDRMGWIQKICWLVVVWAEWKKRQLAEEVRDVAKKKQKKMKPAKGGKGGGRC